MAASAIRKFLNSSEQFSEIAEFLVRFRKAESVVTDDMSRILLCVEEIFTNTVSYAFTDDAEHWISN